MFPARYFGGAYLPPNYFPDLGSGPPPTPSTTGILILDRLSVPIQFTAVSVPLVYDTREQPIVYVETDCPIQFVSKPLPIVYVEGD